MIPEIPPVYFSYVITIVATLVGAIAGFYFGLLRDRSKEIRTQQVKVASILNERLVKIEKQELTDSKTTTLNVQVVSGPQRTERLSDAEIEQLNKWIQYREELLDELNRARLWLHANTVSAMSNYSHLLTICKNWETETTGQIIIEDKRFLFGMKVVFGIKWKKTLKSIVHGSSNTKATWLVNCTRLSHLCRQNIQSRIFTQIKHPFYFATKERIRRKIKT